MRHTKKNTGYSTVLVVAIERADGEATITASAPTIHAPTLSQTPGRPTQRLLFFWRSKAVFLFDARVLFTISEKYAGHGRSGRCI